MPNLQTKEVIDSNKPLILIYSNNKIIQQDLAKEFSKKLSLLFVSNTIPSENTENSYHIKPSDSHLLPLLEERVDYAVVILTDESEKNTLDNVIKKLVTDDSKSAFLFPANNYELFIDVILEIKKYKNIIPALYGEVLEDSASQTQLVKIIRMAVSNQKIKLKGDDMLPVFPISKRDLTSGIKHLLFSNKSKALYYLFYKEPETLLSAIHQIARIEPELQFEMEHERPAERYEERSTMNQILTDKLQLRISYLDRSFKGFIYALEHLSSSDDNKSAAAVTIGRKASKRRIRIPRFAPSVSLAMFFSLILFVILNIVFGILGLLFLRSSIQAFEQNDFQKAKERGLVAKSALGVSMPALNVTESMLSYIPFANGLYETLHLVTTSANLTMTAAELLEQIDKAGEGVGKNEFNKIILDTNYLYHAGSRILLTQNNRAISNLLTEQTTKTLSIIPVLPTLLGYDAEKEYLLLFMNNAELRPGGGFIGSVGRLVVENGKIKEFEINDVYDWDGQLTQHIEPHYIVRRYLQPHLFLRDSNFDLDFQRSASLSAKIYALESKNTPDGVIALDFSIIEKILEVTGPIELKQYNKTITAENSMDFIQDTIEKNFFPGSTQKKDVLNDLFKNITLNLEQNPDNFIRIGMFLPELLNQKHILLSYQNQSVQSLLSALNYGGQIKSAIDDEAINDTIGFNEANIGVNKVNKDISRSIFYQANLDKRVSIAKLSLRNESSTQDYKSYVRLIAPKNSAFRSLKINNKEVETIPAVTDFRVYENKGFAPDPGIYEVESTQDYNMTVFGTVVQVKKGEILTLEFEYTNPKLFLEDGSNNYILNVIKQPGTSSTPSKFNIVFPSEFTAQSENIETIDEKSATINSEIVNDLKYEIEFSKK